jgi:uncharacterized protein with PIN domain
VSLLLPTRLLLLLLPKFREWLAATNAQLSSTDCKKDNQMILLDATRQGVSRRKDRRRKTAVAGRSLVNRRVKTQTVHSKVTLKRYNCLFCSSAHLSSTCYWLRVLGFGRVSLRSSEVSMLSTKLRLVFASYLYPEGPLSHKLWAKFESTVVIRHTCVYSAASTWLQRHSIITRRHLWTTGLYEIRLLS